MTYAVVGVCLVVVWRVVACLVKRVHQSQIIYSEHVSADFDLPKLLERGQLLIGEVPDAGQHCLECRFQASSEHLVVRLGTQHHAVLLLVGSHGDDADI